MPDTVHNFWPFPEYRKLQRKSLAAIAKAFADGNDFVVVEAPTGAGKSPLAIAVARWMIGNSKYANSGERAEAIEKNGKVQDGAYILTTQKLLQRQYLKDFGEHEKWPLVEMRGRGNFRCKFDENPKATCENGVCHSWAETGRAVMLEDGEDPPTGTEERCSGAGQRYYMQEFQISGHCCYRREKARVLQCPLVIHNFSYFMHETNYAGEFAPRSLLIADEAHSIESGLMSFVEVDINEFAVNRMGIEIPADFNKDTPIDEIYTWARSELEKHIRPRMRELDGKMLALNKRLRNNPFDQGALEERSKLRPEFEAAESMVSKLDMLLNELDPSNCVLDMEVKRVRQRGRLAPSRRFTFKPINIAPFAERFLFRRGKKVLMMSATILDPDTFADSLGIDKSRMKFIRIPSTFPAENRKIVFRPCGSMSRRSIEETLPKMADAVRGILETHRGERGMVHVHSYRISDYLVKHVNDPRIMFHGSQDREKILAEFLADPSDDSVLVSPSMTDGLSLDDDLARFQIICKMPFPYLGDPQVFAKKNISVAWYDLETAKRLMQAFGRAVRSSDDHAVTYVLDGDFHRFFSRTKARMFPKYVQDAVIYED